MNKPAAVPRTQAWLNGAERSRLRVLEVTIERGARMFVEMGKALAEIRDTKLYRESHDTFESYCKERWQLTRSRAYQFMEAAGAAVRLSTMVDNPQPQNERVARELARSGDPEGTWDRAVEAHGDKPTAAQVRAIREPGPVEPPASPKDTRFELIEDAVALLQMLPEPDTINFPTDAGDVQVVKESIDWLAAWLPKARAAWRQHLAAQSQARTAA